jgi:hypothetical protein
LFECNLLRNLFRLSHTSLASTSAPQIEVSKLVEIIHSAAQDPSISVLYGTFGHGFNFRAGGWAHVEEVRNALKVWRESHRVHLEPNLSHNAIINRPSNGAAKPSFAYAVSLQRVVDMIDGLT